MSHLFTPTALKVHNPNICALEFLLEKAACLMDKYIILVCRNHGNFKCFYPSREERRNAHSEEMLKKKKNTRLRKEQFGSLRDVFKVDSPL